MERKTANQQFEECYKLLQSEIINEDGYSKMCVIHNVFGDNGLQHNCIACNLVESSELILKYLEKNKENTDVQQDFTIYLLLLYLFVERVEVVFKMLLLPQTYQDNHFKVFQQIRKWANFIKHPKSFILTHHPDYSFENSGNYKKDDFNIVVDDSFVENYYKGYSDINDQKKQNIKLYNKLKNKEKVLVLFPDILQITEKFCYSYNKFIKLITKNEVFIEILKDDTTIMNYFEND